MKTKQFKLLKLTEFIGKPMTEVWEYLKKEYPNQLAKEEHRDVFIASKPKLPNWTWCYFFGSVLCDQVGNWNVPRVFWDGSEFGRSASWLGYDWDSGGRVVLLVDSVLDPLPLPSESLEPLAFRIAKLEEKFEALKKALK